MNIFLLCILLISLLLEGTVTTLPLVLVVLLCLTIIRRDAVVFAVAFVAGIFFDILTVQTIGMSSLFFTVMVFLILLYQRKYEINSYPFVFFATFLGAFGFLMMVGTGSVFGESLIGALIAVILFRIVNGTSKKQSPKLEYKI